MRKNYLFILLLIIITTNFVNNRHLKKLTTIKFPEMVPITLKPYGKLNFAFIKEASGIVKSRLRDNVFWVHNDSGDEARIYPVTKDGKIIKSKFKKEYSGITISNATNVDWEDITTDNNGNLIIGDCGNNDNIRKNLTLYIVKEPSPLQSSTANVIKKVPFYYPDQKKFPPQKKNKNFDAEAIFFSKDKIYLLTKHRGDDYTKLYRFDSMSTSKSNPLTLIGSFRIQDQVTAADASPDGSKLAVLTFSAVWLFEVTGSTDDYFAGKISWLPIRANQCEAICFDSNMLIIANEESELFELALDSLIIVKDL